MVRPPPIPKPIRRQPSGRIPRSAIRRYVNQIVAKFHPQKVILFGSHAYGTPDADSDVDLLVIMPAKNELTQSIRIGQSIWAPFPMDLFVYRPETLAKWLEWEDPYLTEILDKGIVMYEAGDPGVGS